MSSPLGHRAGMAILSIELEEACPGRLLIRVKTVDDALSRDAPVDRPFSDAQAALDYLGDWIDGWSRS